MRRPARARLAPAEWHRWYGLGRFLAKRMPPRQFKKPVSRTGPTSMKPPASGNTMGENPSAVIALNSTNPHPAKRPHRAAGSQDLAKHRPTSTQGIGDIGERQAAGRWRWFHTVNGMASRCSAGSGRVRMLRDTGGIASAVLSGVWRSRALIFVIWVTPGTGETGPALWDGGGPP